MTKEILLNIGFSEDRVAILENGKLVEFSIERQDEQRRAGNIYRGRVENVLPGMEAAFVDIGEEKNAFLYIDDIMPHDAEIDSMPIHKYAAIQDLVHTGQELVVQIVKEPIGTKGARVTTQVTLPGRYLVLMPTMDCLGISRRIETEKERERLRLLVQHFKAPGMGIIVRTVAEGVDEDEIRADYEFLRTVWQKVQKKTKKGPCPALLYRDHDLLYRVLRDSLSKDLTRLLIDDWDAYEKSLELIRSIAPSFKNRIEYYNGETAIFESFRVETQLQKAMQRKVWLENGSYLVLDQTEALTVIDVNTGKYTGSTSLEDTVFQTNLGAVDEIARQIRLRNLAGIILIDFIDMSSDAERERVTERLQRELEKDKAKVTMLGFTNLGLLEFTRKKVRPSLRELLQIGCEFCEGTGYVVSAENQTQRAARAIQQLAVNMTDEALLVGVNPQIAALLIGPGGANLERMERHLQKRIFVKGQETLGQEQVKLLASGSRDEIAFLALPVREQDELEVRIDGTHASNVDDGIARLEGYVIHVAGAGEKIGEIIRIRIVKTAKTHAKAEMIG